MADINQTITQIYLYKLESLSRISELGEEYIPVVFRIPMRAGGVIWTQSLMKPPSFSSCSSSQEVRRTPAPFFFYRGHDLPIEVSFYQLVFKIPSGQISIGSSRSDY